MYFGKMFFAVRTRRYLRMSTRKFGLAVHALALVLVLANFASAQSARPSSTDGHLTAMRLDNVQIEAQGIRQLFSQLSLSYDIPIGLEIASNDDEFARYAIDFKKGMLSDLLTQFVARHNQYAWEIKDGTVSVFPNENYRDAVLDQILKAEIGSFSVRKNTSCWVFEKSLVSTPEIKKILEANGLTYNEVNFSGPYIPQLGRDFTLDVSNMTLKAILNKVIKESPTAKIWIIKRSDRRLLVKLSARHQDSPMRKENFVTPQEKLYARARTGRYL